MALKFLNKKGWHTGSLRNIENVWKAEQKRDAEQKKLEELRKQIQEERERSEFRLLQEQAGLVPKQERLDFLYDSGLAVGKSSSDGFKALEALPKTETEAASHSSSKLASVPGALFEEKPQSANDAWRKLHSDPLLLIRQREQEALARVKNNPIQMAMIRKSVEANKKPKGKKHGRTEHRKKHHHGNSKPQKHSSSKEQSESGIDTGDGEKRIKRSHHKDSKRGKGSPKGQSDSEDAVSEREERRKRSYHKILKHEEHSSKGQSDSEDAVSGREEGRKRSYHKILKREEHSSKSQSDSEDAVSEREERRKMSHHKRLKREEHSYKGQSALEACTSKEEERGKRSDWSHYKLKSEKQSLKGLSDSRDATREYKSNHQAIDHYRSSDSIRQSDTKHARTDAPVAAHWQKSSRKHWHAAPKLSEEERAARLQEMQMDAELHEEQRWKRLKKASEDDAREVRQVGASTGQNFLNATQKSVYGADKGGSSTIEESVRRRTYYLQRQSNEGEGNAFRR